MTTSVTLPDGMVRLVPIPDDIAEAMVALDAGEDHWLGDALHSLRQCVMLDGVKVTFSAGPCQATVTLRSELESYARLRAKAGVARRLGDIRHALECEGQCDELYSRLPEGWRW